ncbi:hypothetical protein RAS1_36570 [Phycisphaerae bacterium RAS1]|nr:hypothetical protein RAS1_36570 [Phycisphaerae bacterium RAS1]
MVPVPSYKVGDKARIAKGKASGKLVEVIAIGPTVPISQMTFGNEWPTMDTATPISTYCVKVLETGEELEVNTWGLEQLP